MSVSTPEALPESSSPQAVGASFLIEETASRPIFTPEQFTEEQRAFFQAATDFSMNEIFSRAREIDEHGVELMPDLLAKAAELGLCAVEIPEEYDGLGLDVTTAMLVTEGLTSVGSFSTSIGAHTGIGTLPIVFFGTEAQKQKYLPRLATTEIIGAYALSEAGSGSDALAAKTTAVLSEDGKHYLLNGGKMWITNAGFAGLFIVFAQVDGDKFTAFIVERDTPGFSLGKEEDKLGLHGSSTRALIFEDAPVPVENVLGEIGKGHRIAFNVLNHGRLKLGIGAIAGAKRMLRIAAQYAMERRAFGKPIGDFGLIRKKIAEMASQTFVGESMAYRASGLIDRKIERTVGQGGDHERLVGLAFEEYATESSVLKVYGSEVCHFVIDEAFQIHGGYGYTEEYPVARAYRDSRVNRIYEGTNEINRLLIPGMLLKRAFKGQFPFMESYAKLQAELELLDALPEPGDGPLAEERWASDRIKRTTLYCLGLAAGTFGMELEQQQEVLGNLADLMIDAYGADSAVCRALQSRDEGLDVAEQQADFARLFVWQAVERVTQRARHTIAATLEAGEARDRSLAIVAALDATRPYNFAALRDRIAERILGEYRTP